MSSDVVVGDGWQGSGGRQRPSRGPDSSAAYSEMVRLAQAAGFSSPAEMMIMQQQQLMTLMQGMQAVAAVNQPSAS